MIGYIKYPWRKLGTDFSYMFINDIINIYIFQASVQYIKQQIYLLYEVHIICSL